MNEPTKKILDYAKKHGLKYNSLGRGGWVFESSEGSVPFSMHYDEIKKLAEKEEGEDDIQPI